MLCKWSYAFSCIPCLWSVVFRLCLELWIVSPDSPEDGYVKVRTLNETDVDLDAAKVSLGVLGVISQVFILMWKREKK